MKNVLFSIIIPTFNNDTTISNIIRDILKQSFKKFEIIIINDCSHDNTLEICEKYKKNNSCIRIISNKKNHGPAFCRNIGLAEANGQWIIFVDADDSIKSDMFLSSINDHIKNNDVILHGSIVSYMHDDKDDWHQLPFVNKINKIEPLYKKINYMITTDNFYWEVWKYALRLDFLKENNIRFVDHYRHAEDFDFIFRLLMCSPRIFGLKNHDYHWLYYDRKTLPDDLKAEKTDMIKVLNKNCQILFESKIENKLKVSLFNMLANNYYPFLLSAVELSSRKEILLLLDNCSNLQLLYKYGTSLKSKILPIIFRFIGVSNTCKIYSLFSIKNKI